MATGSSDYLRCFFCFVALPFLSQATLAQHFDQKLDNHPEIHKPPELNWATITPECSRYAIFVSSELQKIIARLTVAEKLHSTNTDIVSSQLEQELAETSAQREILQKSCEASGGFPRSELTGEK
jgi:hypothetical protein